MWWSLTSPYQPICFSHPGAPKPSFSSKIHAKWRFWTFWTLSLGTLNWPRYNNYAVQNITFKHTKGLGKGNLLTNIRYYLSVRIPPITLIFPILTKQIQNLRNWVPQTNIRVRNQILTTRSSEQYDFTIFLNLCAFSGGLGRPVQENVPNRAQTRPQLTLNSANKIAGTSPRGWRGLEPPTNVISTSFC